MEIAPSKKESGTPNVAPITLVEKPSAPTAIARAANNDFPLSHLGTDFGFEYFKIDAKDPVNGGSAVLLSDMNPEVRFSWDLEWSEQWSSRLRFSYVSEKINNGTSTASTISGGSGSSYGFEFGAIRRWSEKSRTAISLGSVSRIFARSTTTTNVEIDHVQSIEAKVGQEFDLVKVKTATAGVALDASLINGGTGIGYTTKPGYGVELSGFLKHELKSGLELKGEVFYGQSWQNSTLVNQVEQHVGAFFGVSKRFE